MGPSETTYKESLNKKMPNTDALFSQAEQRIEEASHKIKDFSESLKERSGELANESVNFVKKYPLHTALGAAAIGLVAGILLSRPSQRKD